MGMSTHLRAFIPDTDKEYLKHKEVLLLCKKAEVSLPKETMDYFKTNYSDPNEELLETHLEMDLNENEHYKEWGDNFRQGYELDLLKLPEGVTKIRFYNSW